GGRFWGSSHWRTRQIPWLRRRSLRPLRPSGPPARGNGRCVLSLVLEYELLVLRPGRRGKRPESLANCHLILSQSQKYGGGRLFLCANRISFPECHKPGVLRLRNPLLLVLCSPRLNGPLII